MEMIRDVKYGKKVMRDDVLRAFCVDRLPPSEIDRRQGLREGEAVERITAWWREDGKRKAGMVR